MISVIGAGIACLCSMIVLKILASRSEGKIKRNRLEVTSLFQEEREPRRPHEPVHEVSVWLRGHVSPVSADQLGLGDPGAGGAWSQHSGQVSVTRLSRNVA